MAKTPNKPTRPKKRPARAANQPLPALIMLAREKFENLEMPEAAMMLFISQGKVFTYSDKAKAAKQNVIRAEVLSWLCKDPAARDLIPDDGIQITGARIEGLVDLQFAQFNRPLRLVDCDIRSGLLLKDATFRMLSLKGSQIGNFESNTEAIIADGAKITRGVFLIDGFVAKGEVRFVGSEIGGDLACINAKFHNENGRALAADGAKIKGSVSMRDGFEAKGEVRFLGAEIGSDLACIGGKFHNEGLDEDEVSRKAFGADGAKIGRNVFLSEGFEAKGEVRLLGAEIGGNLVCVNGKFYNEKDKALSVDGARITGDVSLSHGFEAKGEVRFLGAEIGGILNCAKGTLHNVTGPALSAEGAQITGSVFMREGCTFHGQISLVEAQIKTQFQWINVTDREKAILDLRGMHARTLWIGKDDIPEPNQIFLHGMTYDSIHDEMETSRDWWKVFIERQRTVSPESRVLEAQAQAASQSNVPIAAQALAKEAAKKLFFLPQPYEQAAKILRQHGHDDDAKELLIAKERLRKRTIPPLRKLMSTNVKELGGIRSGLSTLTQWAWYHVFAPVIGYGHRPSPALWVAALCIVIGYGVFANAHALNLMQPIDPAKEVEFQPFIYAVETFTPLIKLRQADYWHANTQTNLGCALSCFTFVYTIGGWVLTTLLATALAGLVRK